MGWEHCSFFTIGAIRLSSHKCQESSILIKKLGKEQLIVIELSPSCSVILSKINDFWQSDH